MNDKQFIDAIEAGIHECAPDHSTQLVTVGDLRRMIRIVRLNAPGHRWKIERTVKAVGDREF